MVRQDVLDFIQRRFQSDCDWLSGNCYYFAIILQNRFPEGVLYYDVIDGHFVVRIDDVYYDWTGVSLSFGQHYYVPWDTFEEYDAAQKQIIIRDCIK